MENYYSLLSVTGLTDADIKETPVIFVPAQLNAGRRLSDRNGTVMLSTVPSATEDSAVLSDDQSMIGFTLETLFTKPEIVRDIDSTFSSDLNMAAIEFTPAWDKYAEATMKIVTKALKDLEARSLSQSGTEKTFIGTIKDILGWNSSSTSASLKAAGMALLFAKRRDEKLSGLFSFIGVPMPQIRHESKTACLFKIVSAMTTDHAQKMGLVYLGFDQLLKQCPKKPLDVSLATEFPSLFDLLDKGLTKVTQGMTSEAVPALPRGKKRGFSGFGKTK